MKIKKALLFMIIFMMGLFCIDMKYALGEEYSNNNGVSLSPAYRNLGSITEGTKSFKVTVMNSGEDVHLKAKIDNAEHTKISIVPDNFSLAKNEKKEVIVTINSDKDTRIGVYDLTIAFITDTKDQQSISAFGTNSLRLKFRKEGLALATCNVRNTAPIQEGPFYSILCNFYNKKQKVTVDVEILNKASGELIWQKSEKLTLKPYPVEGYYGQVETPVPEEPWKYGDYVYRLVAHKKDKVLLTYQTEFNVGELKGKLESITTKDVRKGDMAGVRAVVQNIGTQELPVSVDITVKDKKNNEIYHEVKTDQIHIDSSKEIVIEWPTKNSKTGKHSIEYVVIMGNQRETGTLYYNVKQSQLFIFIVVGFSLLIILVFIICILALFKKRICNKNNNNNQESI